MPATIKSALVTLMAVLLLTVGTSGHAHASSTVQENPSALAMVGDALFVRPAMLAFTVVGTVVYTASLPFSLAGGNAKQAGQTLVVGPAKTTFVRCLGCTMPGRQTATVVGQDQD